MKTLSLFLKDGKLMAAFLPEKPDDSNVKIGFGHANMDFNMAMDDYERAKSEALRQAMEVVVHDLPYPGDVVWKERGEYCMSVDDQTSQTLKEGEFYKWEGDYKKERKYDCNGRCLIQCEQPHICYVVKLLPGNVKEPETNEEPQDNADLVKMKIRKALIRAAIDLGPASREALADMIYTEILTTFTITRKA